jgi:hypothetical protein
MQHSRHSELESWLRTWVEERYYGLVNKQARFEVLVNNEHFWEAPAAHVGLFSDHGVVHVRDVARQVVQVLDIIHGQLIPARSMERFEGFMKPYAVALALLHDIGMADFSAFGRAMHPEFAAQAVFSPELAPFIEAFWEQDYGGLPSYLRSLAEQGLLDQPAAVVGRELLALSMGHSKSKVPIDVLNNPAALRATAQQSLGTDLPELYRVQQQRKGRSVTGDLPVPAISQAALLRHYYHDFAGESFRWLVSEQPALRTMVEDVIDTLRALRAADALRQRGSVQKTSGGYEVFISQQTGGAIYALRLGSERLYLLETNDHMSAGEANIASTEIDKAGNLRISFHRGAFGSEIALAQAVTSTAIIVKDIRADVIESFRRSPDTILPTGIKAENEIETWLESTDDNPGFAEQVRVALQRMEPPEAPPVDIAPSLQGISERERNRYLAAAEVDWGKEERQALIERMALSGCKLEGLDLHKAFRHVRIAHLAAGEVLVEAGEPAGIVYVPLGGGLVVRPLGGYAQFSVQAWMPLGNTGVIRGALRNGSVYAETPVSTLVIPKAVYLRYWHATYTATELRKQAGLV